jgi:hypothetical protein
VPNKTPLQKFRQSQKISNGQKKMGTMACTGHIPQRNGFHDSQHNGHEDSCTIEMWFFWNNGFGKPHPRRPI